MKTDSHLYSDLVDTRLSRRAALLGLTSIAALAGLGLGRGAHAAQGASSLTFTELTKIYDETHHVATGYKAETLAPGIWAEVKALGIVKPEAVLLDQDIARFPVTFKMPKTGFTASVERFKEDIAKRSRRVVLRNVIPFFRRDVYLDSLTVRGLVE